MDGSYFDRMWVGELKQQTDTQLAGASRELEEKVAQQWQESLRLTQWKRKKQEQKELDQR